MSIQDIPQVLNNKLRIYMYLFLIINKFIDILIVSCFFSGVECEPSLGGPVPMMSSFFLYQGAGRNCKATVNQLNLAAIKFGGFTIFERYFPYINLFKYSPPAKSAKLNRTPNLVDLQ